ncbi:MAG: ABC-F family ATP-binding cassette domain-containing protein [Candidatus Cloacimonadales bacterium]
MKKNIVSVDSLQKEFPNKIICKQSSFGIHEGDKIGLVGINGCGKSTLLKMMTGLEPADSGKIVVRKGITIGYLQQIPQLQPEQTIYQQIYYSDQPAMQLLREYYQLSARLAADPSAQLQAEHREVMTKLDAIDGWKIEVRAKSLLSQLGLEDFSQQISTLSGGQKRRLDLARVLLDQPNLLFLDEPTNHLDIETIEWFQDFLLDFKGAVVFVTHDRYFLDAVCNKILEIEAGTLRFYEGTYSHYIKQKELELIDTQRKETRRKAQLSKELQWLQRGAKARTSKPKNHVDRVKELISKSYLTSSEEMEISFGSQRLGKTILEIKQLSKAYGDNVLVDKFSHNFQKLERVGIIGANGCGKTTLLKMIMGEVEADSGTIKVGLNTKFAYFRQDSEDFLQDITVLDYIQQSASTIRTADGSKFSASEMLQKFLFDGKMQQSKLHLLSGGEKKRLYLMKSLMFGANFIILDEPTNDLDIKTLEILEDYLDAFRGCLLVVSHDRYFLDRTVDYLFVFENNQIKKFPGNYSDSLLVRRYQAEEQKEQNTQQKVRSKPEKLKQVKLSFNEKRELAKLDGRIAELSAEIESLSDKIEQEAATLDHREFAKISTQQQKLEAELDELELRWLELDEKR